MQIENIKKHWFLFLKLLLAALGHIPNIHRTVCRGNNVHVKHEYQGGENVTWWDFSPSSRTIGVLNVETLLSSKCSRPLFMIDCLHSKDIRLYSAFPDEDEILLPAAREFQVLSCLSRGPDLFIVQLQEIQRPLPLFNLIEEVR